MNPEGLAEAMAVLGKRWKLGRDLHASELGVVLRYGGRDPGVPVRKWLAGSHAMPGPCVVAVRAMVAGYKPADMPRPGLMAERERKRLARAAYRRKVARQKEREKAAGQPHAGDVAYSGGSLFD